MILLESAFMLLLNSVLLMLRIAPGDSFPKPLTREEEKACLERWLAGDLEARNVLVEHNLRLVAHIVKKYYQTDDADELISIGSIGLIKGINTYRPDKGAPCDLRQPLHQKSRSSWPFGRGARPPGM